MICCRVRVEGVHGACIATCFDEILAYPVWRLGYNAFTANLNINFKAMIPLGSTVRFTAQIQKIENNKKIFVYGRLTSPDESTVYSDCLGLWVVNSKLNSIGNVRGDVLQKLSKL